MTVIRRPPKPSPHPESRPGRWRLWLREFHVEIRERIGYAALKSRGLLGPYESPERAEIDERIAWLAQHGVTTEAELTWIEPVGEQPPRLGEEASAAGSIIRVTGLTMLEYARACDDPSPADVIRERLTDLVATAYRVAGEPDPRETHGHGVRYRARSYRTGIALNAIVSYVAGVYTVEEIHIEGYGRRRPPIGRRTEQEKK